MYRWLVWNCIFRLHEWAKGHPTYRFLREMESADCLTAAELQDLQAARLQAFLGYCYAHVPYIRNQMQQTGVDPSNIQKPADLAKLPVMRKADVRANRASLRSELARKLVPSSTGGSTGEPLLFDLSKVRIAAHVACRQRALRWWGLTVGDREFVVWGSPLELTRQDRLRKLRDTLLATELLSAFEMSEPVMSRYLDLIASRGCRMIFGYPSSIYLLCLHARKQARNLRRLGIKVAFVTGEVLFPFQRELIGETLNCPVANGYGGRESGFIAHECPQGGMHVMADSTVIEIVDSQCRPVSQGESGEIVVTDLYSYEAPLLRYATGDIGVLSSAPCICGRALPLLERIQGRSTDFVVAPDGRILHGLSLIYIFREIDGIEQFRVYQRKNNSFHVQVVRNKNFRTQYESQIREGFLRRLRAPVELTFEYLPNIPLERSGKFRHVVSELTGSPGSQQAIMTDLLAGERQAE